MHNNEMLPDCFRCAQEWDLAHPDEVFPLAATRMWVCPVCGNKRCPKATDHRLDCTDSNEPGQPGSRYERQERQIMTKSQWMIAIIYYAILWWVLVNGLDTGVIVGINKGGGRWVSLIMHPGLYWFFVVFYAGHIATITWVTLWSIMEKTKK